MATSKKAGHRRWAARGGKVAGVHTGDIMSAAKRSALMARIRGKNTTPEMKLDTQLLASGLEYERHSKNYPGRPDFIFLEARVAVFVDGDFWHGYRFPLWKHKLAPRWQEKIERNRSRDKRNFAALRRAGWKVLRIWEHQIEKDNLLCAQRVISVVRLRLSRAN